MAAAPSRLPLDPSTNLPSIHTFAQLSNFLRASVADEDSRLFSDSMRNLSVQIESIIASLRATRASTAIAPMLMDLLTVLRAHRQFVVNLGLEWRGLYEYAAYLQALNYFRVLIGQWLLDGGAQGGELPVAAEDFELVAWRTLGEGMLLIDMYEQWLGGDSSQGSGFGSLTEPKVDRANQWWKRLRL